MEEQRDLSLVIIVNSSFSDKTLLTQFIAKAPVMLITRCFKNMPDFIGNYESTQYEKDILEWTNNSMPIKIVQVEDSDAVEGYMFITEMNGLPSKILRYNNEIVLLVAGPSNSGYISEIVQHEQEYV